MRRIAVFFLLFIFSSVTCANLPYFPLEFPRDEGAHFKNIPYSFSRLIEWWYFNGFIETTDGHKFGYDVAIFHPAINKDKIYAKPFLHIQIADLDNKKSYGYSGEFPINYGRFSTTTLAIELDDVFGLWRGLLSNEIVYTLEANVVDGGTALGLNLTLEPTSSIFLINENGLMPMMDDTNSYYYSIPHLKTSGTLKINQASYQINDAVSDSWMDHQWGDFSTEKSGWEWMSVRLKNGLVANIFMNIEYKTKKVVGGLANIILPNGEKRFISYKDFLVKRENYWLDPKLGIEFPMMFKFTFPTIGLYVESSAAFPEQELNGYWEGFSNVKANYLTEMVDGFSYVELVYSRQGMRDALKV